MHIFYVLVHILCTGVSVSRCLCANFLVVFSFGFDGNPTDFILHIMLHFQKLLLVCALENT